jgi:BirA family biotin operon repressor/biotin-[acetyl-CoA-carboxylase] ligase
MGVDVVYCEASASTMDDARAGAAAGNPPGTAYVAGTQTAGRGRLGRVWQSAPRGLYVTYHLRPRDAAIVPLLTVAGALAVSDAIRETALLVTEVKWPNDVLHQGRKLAGILAESTIGDRIDVFLGLGLNVGVQQFPAEVAVLATTIEEASGAAPPHEELLAALSSALDRHVTQLARSPAVLVEEWRARLVTLGHRVRLSAVDGRTFEGDAVDVTPRGELILRLDDGALVPFAAGDVTMA